MLRDAFLHNSSGASRNQQSGTIIDGRGASFLALLVWPGRSAKDKTASHRLAYDAMQLPNETT